MRKRSANKPSEIGVRVAVVLVDDPSRMVTLTDPAAGAEPARGAFARLRVPEGLGPVETDAWRLSVAAIARAYRVLPPIRSQVVPMALARANAVSPTQGVRDEIMQLAREANDDELIADIERTLAEVG